MNINSPVFHFIRPAFSDKRGGSTLFVWDEIAKWMVVDKELSDFLNLFDGITPLDKIIERHLGSYGGNPLEETAKIHHIIKFLEQLGVICKNIKRVSGEKMDDEPIKIFNVTFNITNKCNLSCPFCYNKDKVTAESDIKDVVSSIAGLKPVMDSSASLIVLGGEPFLNSKRLFSLLEQTKDLFSVPVMISTNGTLIDKSVVKELKKYNVEIQVSLDSPIESEHDKLRGKGVYQKAVSTITMLVDEGIPAIMSMVYSSANYKHIESYLELAKTLNVSEARFIPLRIIGGGVESFEFIPDNYEVFKYLLDVLKKNPQYCRLLKRDYFSILGSVCRFSSKRCNCGIGRNVIFIDADGSIYPCPNNTQKDFCAGNIMENSVLKIFKEAEVFKTIRKCYHVSRYESCRNCFIRYWCGGDCKGEVYSLNKGSIKEVSPHCEEIKKLFVEILWLLSEDSHPFVRNINQIENIYS